MTDEQVASFILENHSWSSEDNLVKEKGKRRVSANRFGASKASRTIDHLLIDLGAILIFLTRLE